MKNAKNKINNATRRLLLGSIMKKSGNYLPLTNREGSMIKWFLKFNAIIVVNCLVWFTPFTATQDHLSHVKDLEVKISTPEVHAAPRATQSEIPISLYEVKAQTIREISAYNAGDVNQTDSSPCISANGENICNALDAGFKRCAANFVPFGTELLIENADKSWRFQCMVVDRMNRRYPNRVDIAMTLSEKDRAIRFGVQRLSVKILEKK